MKKYRILIIFLLIIVPITAYPQSYNDVNNNVETLTDAISISSNESTLRRINSAKSLLAKVEQLNNYVDKLTELGENKQIPLPVGLSSESCRYKLVVSQISHNCDSSAKVYMTCAIPIDKSKTLAFDGECRFTGNCGPSMPGKLQLIDTCSINFGSTFKILFKKDTYCEFDCNGISRFYIKASLEFTTKNMTFYDDKDNVLSTKPVYDIELYCNDLKDFEFQLENKLNFSFKGLDGFVFHLENITIDNSESHTSNTASFPAEYFTDDYYKNLWTGLAVRMAEVNYQSH